MNPCGSTLARRGDAPVPEACETADALTALIPAAAEAEEGCADEAS